MKSSKSLATFVALAAALSVNTATASPAAPVTTVEVAGVNVPVAHEGYGLGSVKCAPFAHYNSVPSTASPLYFHTTTGIAAINTPTAHEGFGPGSSKLPYAAARS